MNVLVYVCLIGLCCSTLIWLIWMLCGQELAAAVIDELFPLSHHSDDNVQPGKGKMCALNARHYIVNT